MNLILLDDPIWRTFFAASPDGRINTTSATSDASTLFTNGSTATTIDKVAPQTKRPRTTDVTFVTSLSKTDPRATHITKHLKKNVGDRIRIGFLDGGPVGEAKLLDDDKNNDDETLSLEIDLKSLRPPPDRPCVHLLLGVSFPKVIKQLWPIIVSLGVESVSYVSAALTNPDFLKTSVLTENGYMPLVKEGLAQAEDTRIPHISTPTEYHTDGIQRWLKNADLWFHDDKLACKIVLHIGNHKPIRNICNHKCHGQPKSILLAIGPERGWTDDEVELFQTQGFYLGSLGTPVLKTETAVIAGIALARDVLIENEENSKV